MANSSNKTKATLDKKSISAIADQVEARMRETPSNASEKKKAAGDGHGGGKKVFFWGAASGLAAAFALPLFGRQARPVVRGAIKGGIIAGRYVQKAASSVKEDVQDITAEAKADLDVEDGSERGPEQR
jgi:Protein of unknown function (DUF5132)